VLVGVIGLSCLLGADANWLRQKVGHDMVIGKCDSIFPCSVANAECLNATCVCKEGHIAIRKEGYECEHRSYNVHYSRRMDSTSANDCIQSCMPVSDYKKPCINDAQCLAKLGKHGSCLPFPNGNRGGTCGCREAEQEYDLGFHYSEGRCWQSSRINSHCESDLSCTTPNSYCQEIKINKTEVDQRYRDPYAYRDPYYHGMHQTSRCQCLPEFPVYLEPDDTCLSASGYGEQCDFSIQCRHQLGYGSVCKDSMNLGLKQKDCQCKDGYTYNKNSKKCLSDKKIKEEKDETVKAEEK